MRKGDQLGRLGGDEFGLLDETCSSAEQAAVIAQRLSSDVALIDQIAHYIVHAGGKRMRPKLVQAMALVVLLLAR